MSDYYTLKVCHVEVYEWTDKGQGDHVCSKDGFTLGSFDTVDCCKAYLEDFFGDNPDYEAYEGDNFLSCSRIEDVDAYPSYNPDERQFIADYMVMIEKVSHVSWGNVEPTQDRDNNEPLIARSKVPALNADGKFIYNEGSTA